jgi:hypothetical protein
MNIIFPYVFTLPHGKWQTTAHHRHILSLKTNRGSYIYPFFSLYFNSLSWPNLFLHDDLLFGLFLFSVINAHIIQTKNFGLDNVKFCRITSLMYRTKHTVKNYFPFPCYNIRKETLKFKANFYTYFRKEVIVTSPFFCWILFINEKKT